MHASTATQPLNDANRLGLDYRAEADAFTHPGPLLDVHTHLTTLESARLFFEAADLYGVTHVWTMSPLEIVDDLTAEFGGRLHFIAVPNYAKREDPETFTTDWLRRIEAFAEKGSKICKFWVAPRRLDFGAEALSLDSPICQEAQRLAHSLGMMFMTHVADPDTWFATKYVDAAKYGSKPDQYPPLERLLDQYPDTPCIGAHMGGYPEDLDFLQGLLDRHPNYCVDTSATKWMVRELSRHPARFADFVKRNPGRVLFGSDIVTNDDNLKDPGFDQYASRYWALRTLMETAYRGPSPIVDPDLHLVDPSVDEKSTADLHGADLEPTALHAVYHSAAERLLMGM